MNALYFESFGDSSVLTYGPLPTPSINEQDLLVEMSLIGLNYADIYRRKGTYHIEKHLPYINGYEGIGTVTACGSQVTNFQIGDKVLFVDVPLANAELVRVPADHAIKVPVDLPDELVASIGLQGLTADFLAYDLGRNQSGETVFVHGITGGVGQILSQLLTANGVNVYGATSTLQKQQLALEQGAKKVFLRNTDWELEYANFFDTVYDGIGSTLKDSLALVKNRGNVVFFGMAGGNPPEVDFIHLLSQSKSILTGDLWDYLISGKERTVRSERLFSYFKNGKIQISAPKIYSLADGKAAHDFLESGKSMGKILLKP
ncbi:zinc-binding dehydrogenase [Enterococcus sp. AZ109]|uniref:zinc-binding dehydrogenase n=1 Tax=Enterococcus sp. AZ109 TaxID=2774634 RepID=UPI003F296434